MGRWMDCRALGFAYMLGVLAVGVPLLVNQGLQATPHKVRHTLI